MLTIIGCGNRNRSDDGAGSLVAERLLARFGAETPGLRVLDAGTSGMEVMFRARGSTALVIVDASSTGSEPGAIFQVPGAELASAPAPGLSLHGFRWEHALYAGKRLFARDFPEDVRVYLIEARDVGLGLEVSPEVEAAIETVVELIAARVGCPPASKPEVEAP